MDYIDKGLVAHFFVCSVKSQCVSQRADEVAAVWMSLGAEWDVQITTIYSSYLNNQAAFFYMNLEEFSIDTNF